MTAAWLSGRALADGAFPDELSVYLPPADPGRILLGANFGLVISPDSGASWQYVCELFVTRDANDVVNYYKIASQKVGQEAAPFILAISLIHFARSGDGGCTWQSVGGSIASLYPRDAFIDSNDSSFVFALASDFTTDGIYPSTDGAATFGAAVYTTPNNLASIEIARSDGNVVYATELGFSGAQAGSAFLLRSTDRGATWPNKQLLDVPSGAVVRIAAVDPQDSTTVYLRVFTPATGQDEIRITTNGGATLTSAISVQQPELFSAFLTAGDGTRYAATSNADLFAALPDAGTFTKRIGPRARCLGQRPGSARIFACGDQLADGYNLGYSDDGALTFQRMMNFTDISGPLTCEPLHTFCLPQFEMLKSTLGADAGTRATDGGTSPQPASSGCTTVGVGGILDVSTVLLFFLRRRRRKPSYGRASRSQERT